MQEVPISLPHIVIVYMTSMLGSGHHHPYAHTITIFLKTAQVDLCFGGRKLTDIDLIGMASLKAMKYYYIHIERWWIREEDILINYHYEGYESPHKSLHLVNFDKSDYLDYSFLFSHGDGDDDEV
ncbi:hypothetical protein Scep_028007 [Stephania cephalantha]|uniref:Uncharacterized protein n=1 Tax=Stephania cephalantha TaxID=152367 RepID=A0AAP0EBB5_9MAGN